MLENISQKQFEHILDILIIYKQTNPKQKVYLNEKSIKEACNFMNTTGKELSSKLGMNNDE